MAAALVWAVAIAITGGVVIDTPWRPVTSRNIVRPLFVAAVLGSLYAARWRRHWLVDLGPLTALRYARRTALFCTGFAFVIGVGWGTFMGAGPDPSGYVSQADLWARGVLSLDVPEWARDAPWNDAVWSSAPVGYRPASTGDAIAPTYAPGLPLLMALFQIAGGSRAIFYVVPLLSALAVWATFLLGRRLGGEWAGAIASLLLAFSPAFMTMSVQPMADVPATAFWALAVALAWRPGAGPALAAGAAAASAVLIRPNIGPLVGLVALVVVSWPGARLRRFALFSAPVTVAAAFIGWLNWYWYGSPFESGYGTLADLYAADRIAPNLQRYVTWLISSHTPLILAGMLAPFALRRVPAERFRTVVVTALFPLSVLGLYVAYLVFEEWQYLRFLLPALPPLYAGFAAVLVEWMNRQEQRAAAAVAVVVVTLCVALYGFFFAAANRVFVTHIADRRYARCVAYTRNLPANAVLMSNLHSGTLRHYSGHDVLRFEVLTPENIDAAVRFLHARSRPVYLVLDDAEVEDFRARHGGTNVAAALDKPLEDLGDVYVYRLDAAR